MERETVEAFHMTGKSHDCGSKLGNDFKAYLTKLTKLMG
jgi:UTP-glucose-1-phosphate uridylyltransferase